MRRLSPALPLVLVFTAAGLASLPQPANAADDGVIDVSAEVVASCDVVSGSIILPFGDYDPGNLDPTDASTVFAVECTHSTSVEVSLTGGNPLADDGSRQMGDGTNFLKYDLFQDDAREIKFGDNADALGIDVVPESATDVDVYGRIPTGQIVPTGTYTDNVTINLTV